MAGMIMMPPAFQETQAVCCIGQPISATPVYQPVYQLHQSVSPSVATMNSNTGLPAQIPYQPTPAIPDVHQYLPVVPVKPTYSAQNIEVLHPANQLSIAVAPRPIGCHPTAKSQPPHYLSPNWPLSPAMYGPADPPQTTHQSLSVILAQPLCSHNISPTIHSKPIN